MARDKLRFAGSHIPPKWLDELARRTAPKVIQNPQTVEAGQVWTVTKGADRLTFVITLGEHPFEGQSVVRFAGVTFDFDAISDRDILVAPAENDLYAEMAVECWNERPMLKDTLLNLKPTYHGTIRESVMKQALKLLVRGQQAVDIEDVDGWRLGRPILSKKDKRLEWEKKEEKRFTVLSTPLFKFLNEVEHKAGTATSASDMFDSAAMVERRKHDSILSPAPFGFGDEEGHVLALAASSDTDSIQEPTLEEFVAVSGQIGGSWILALGPSDEIYIQRLLYRKGMKLPIGWGLYCDSALNTAVHTANEVLNKKRLPHCDHTDFNTAHPTQIDGRSLALSAGLCVLSSRLGQSLGKIIPVGNLDLTGKVVGVTKLEIKIRGLAKSKLARHIDSLFLPAVQEDAEIKSQLKNAGLLDRTHFIKTLEEAYNKISRPVATAVPAHISVRHPDQRQSEDFPDDIYYVNVGEGRHRSWDDCRTHGFLSAGQGPQWRDQFKKYKKGDIVVPYLKGHGYVGVGVVIQEALPVKDFKINGHPLSEFALKTNIYDNRDDEDKSEYPIGVKWLVTVDAKKAKWKKGHGLYTTTHLRASMKNQKKTLCFIEDEFHFRFTDALRVPGEVPRVTDNDLSIPPLKVSQSDSNLPVPSTSITPMLITQFAQVEARKLPRAVLHKMLDAIESPNPRLTDLDEQTDFYAGGYRMAVRGHRLIFAPDKITIIRAARGTFKTGLYNAPPHQKDVMDFEGAVDALEFFKSLCGGSVAEKPFKHGGILNEIKNVFTKQFGSKLAEIGYQCKKHVSRRDSPQVTAWIYKNSKFTGRMKLRWLYRNSNLCLSWSDNQKGQWKQEAVVIKKWDGSGMDEDIVNNLVKTAMNIFQSKVSDRR